MKAENQIGCGYCKNEETCEIRDPKINKAKLGCEKFHHYKTLGATANPIRKKPTVPKSRILNHANNSKNNE
tara:strand:+ start:1107 stop:1319 length:213 start_codon:yes stop_codon:yes gene_type:complete